MRILQKILSFFNEYKFVLAPILGILAVICMSMYFDKPRIASEHTQSKITPTSQSTEDSNNGDIQNTKSSVEISNTPIASQCNRVIAKEYENKFISHKQFTLKNHDIYISSIKSSHAKEKASRPNDAAFLTQQEYELEVKTVNQTNEFLRSAYNNMIEGLRISGCSPGIAEPSYFSQPTAPIIPTNLPTYSPAPTFQVATCTSQVKSNIESSYQAALNTASINRSNAISQAQAVNAYSGSAVITIDNLYNQEVATASSIRLQQLQNAGC